MEETYLETDINGNFMFFNDSLCRVLGYSRAELQNMNYRLISPPGSKQKIFEIFNEIYKTGEKKTFMHHAVMVRDGSIKFLEMSIALMHSPAGEPTGFRIISREVTEKIKATQAIEESERQLRLIT
jgi:PAS domain S-box-containing protein